MKLPVRKCYHTAKVAFFLLIVIIVIALFEQWRGGKRTAQAQTSEEELYEKLIREDEALIIPGLGENGEASELTGEDKRLGEESERKLAINVYLSDRISYNRTLRDHRNPACERVVYDAELPSASVILIFHNEPYSVVIRTIWSVVNSARRDREWYKKANYVDRETGNLMKLGYPGQDQTSPFVYLKEIILVDDNSTLPELKGKLDYYVRTRLPPDLIRIIRLPNRIGLTRARLEGSKFATADVIVFLDAHCEVQRDWLRPLLQRIRDSSHAVVVPIIDVIEASNFYYSVQDPVTFQVGGFTFMGHFTWIDVPAREKKRRGSDIAPTWSPTMAGGLFAISRQYFWEVGAYDEQMGGWGGENLEMSFRIWQCGGTLETIPCSRVGHVFRSFHPYGLPANTDTHGINTARMAEVWMDDYAELFYLHRPDLRKSPKIGDVTHRHVLREKLKCKSFQWYLDNVYREKFVPVRDVFGFGRFKNPSTGMCIDTLQHEGDSAPLGVYPCHAHLEPTQHLALSLRGELRDEERCAEPRRSPSGSDSARRVVLVNCHGRQREQKWRYLDSKQLQHAASGLCLASGARAADLLALAPCLATPLQLWHMDYSELNGFRLDDTLEPSEQELRLKKLRGQRRIVRSLKAVPERTEVVKPKKRKVKNKFIVKMLRRVNGSEEHLEADIYCRHQRLRPNNTFVRDLVKILNANNIKVINNGRMFEHNTVRPLTALERDEEERDRALRARPVRARETDSNVTRPTAKNAQRKKAKAWKKIQRTKLQTTTEVETIPDDSLPKDERSIEDISKVQYAASTEVPNNDTDKESDEDWPVEIAYLRDGMRRRPHSDEVQRLLERIVENEDASEDPGKLVVRSNFTVDLDDLLGLRQGQGKPVDEIENMIEDAVIDTKMEHSGESTKAVKKPVAAQHNRSDSDSEEEPSKEKD